MSFLAFEGLDGSGKSTLIRKLSESLHSQQIDHIVTHEPGGTELAEEIRELILRMDGEAPSSRCELLLYGASRAQHVDKVLKPSLDQGQWVLCDRFTASTMAFQVGGRQLDEQSAQKLNAFATDGLEPNLWVLLDLPFEESLKRREKREQEGDKDQDRLESEKAEFHEAVRAYYLKLAKSEKNQWLVLDATKTSDELFEALLTELRKRKWLP